MQLTWILDPKGQGKMYWDTFILVLVFYTAFSIPFHIGFRQSETLYFYLSNIFLELIYFLDTIVSLNTAYSDPGTDSLVSDRRMIFFRFVKTHFVLDLISCFPFEIILSAANNGIFDNYRQNMSSISIFRFVSALKIVKLYKFRELEKIIHGLHLNKWYIGAQVLLIIVIFVAHLLGCIWNFIATRDMEPDTIVQTLYSNATRTVSVSYDIDSWVYYFRYEKQTIVERYITCIYWTIPTMMAVGYGDIHPVKRSEQVFAIVVELTGVVVFGAIIAQMVEFLDKINPKNRYVKIAVGELQAYMAEQPMPQHVIAAARVSKLHLLIFLCH